MSRDSSYGLLLQLVRGYEQCSISCGFRCMMSSKRSTRKERCKEKSCVQKQPKNVESKGMPKKSNLHAPKWLATR